MIYEKIESMAGKTGHRFVFVGVIASDVDKSSLFVYRQVALYVGWSRALNCNLHLFCIYTFSDQVN